MHPEHLPPGMDATNSTSHQLQHALRKHGWRVEELRNEVRLVMPGHAADVVVDAVLGAGEDETDIDVGVAFGFEAQLRDFIAHNLKKVAIGGRSLSLFTDPTGRSGVEYPTDVGSIDILARDEDGGFFVFRTQAGQRARSNPRPTRAAHGLGEAAARRECAGQRRHSRTADR